MPNAVLSRLNTERENLLALCDQITDSAESDDRDLSDAERELISRHQQRIESEIDPQLDQLERLEVTRAQHQRAAGALPEPTRRVESPDTDVEVYRSFAQFARDQIVSRFDQIAQLAGGATVRRAAQERVERAVANTLSSDVPGLIRPQYLDQIVQVIDKSRPIVESARRVGLTSGKLSYPSVTTKPIVGKQAGEKTEAPSQKMAVVFVDVIADTYVGAGDLSWQAINWSTPDALSLWFDLAAEQFAIQTEAATGTVVAAATAMALPAIPAAPTLADWMTAIAAAAGTIYATSRRRPDTVYADIASGYSMMGLVSNVSPIFLPGGSFSLSSGQGNVAGLKLVISPGLPAKTVVVGDSQSLLAAETPGAPVELRAVEPAIGGMEVGVIGAFVSKITDTGAFRKLTIA